VKIAGNLFTDSNAPKHGERFDTLMNRGNVTIERIVSSTRIEPTPCVQTQDEWVVLLSGRACIECDDATFELEAGDYMFIPAQTAHTVTSTSENALWLAVHIHSAGQPGD
jgi:cupin 2 domain-containing protein